MPGIISSAARFAELSRFVLEHASFRPSIASESEFASVWSAARELGGLPADAAGQLAGALVVLGYLPSEQPGPRSESTRRSVGTSHYVGTSAPALVAPDETAHTLRGIDSQGIENVLRVLPESRVPKELITGVLRAHVELASSESTEVPKAAADALGLLDLQIGTAGMGDGAIEVAGPESLLSGTLGRNETDVVARAWSRLLESRLLNPSLVPSGIVATTTGLHAPVGWTNLIEIPEALMTSTVGLLTALAEDDPDCDEHVKAVLTGMQVPTETSALLTDRLRDFHGEARWLRAQSRQGSPSDWPARRLGSDAAVGVLLMSQMCSLLAARRAIERAETPPTGDPTHGLRGHRPG